ncbi:unnamed protein product [Prorocentrum cordatum]|uniref:TFIIS N-terminal domain-containing protein n=1 Tax=Prorocentrum cordatum TaxID=2364126 RepID=A0ABN9QYR2_9DINO|nr:unnamed protein product [Polarella glacialis]
MGGGHRQGACAGSALDSSWTFQAQLRALATVGPEDLTFREASVQDVSDRGREKAAARLKGAFQEVFPRPPSPERAPAAKRPRHAPAARGEADDPRLEAEVRHAVSDIVTHLRLLRKEGSGRPDRGRDEMLLRAMRQLESLPVSVRCLKATKVALELNDPCWRTGAFSAEVRELAAGLVRGWRAMFKAENPSARSSSGASRMSEAAWAVKCQNVSMDLEGAIYGLQQRSDRYHELVAVLCKLLHWDHEACRSLLASSRFAKDLAARAESAVRHRRVAALSAA